MLVNHLVVDHDPVFRLNQQNVVVVGTGRHRRAGHAPQDAALAERPIQPGVEAASDAAFFARVGRLEDAARVGPLLTLGGQRRDFPVRRIDDQRGLVADDFLAVVPPEIVVGARDIRSRPAVPAILVEGCAPGLLVLGDFGVAQRRFVGELSRPLQRRHAAVVPYALQIRLTVHRPRRRIALPRSRLRVVGRLT